MLVLFVSLLPLVLPLTVNVFFSCCKLRSFEGFSTFLCNTRIYPATVSLLSSILTIHCLSLSFTDFEWYSFMNSLLWLLSWTSCYHSLVVILFQVFSFLSSCVLFMPLPLLVRLERETLTHSSFNVTVEVIQRKSKRGVFYVYKVCMFGSFPSSLVKKWTQEEQNSHP